MDDLLVNNKFLFNLRFFIYFEAFRDSVDSFDCEWKLGLISICYFESNFFMFLLDEATDQKRLTCIGSEIILEAISSKASEICQLIEVMRVGF